MANQHNHPIDFRKEFSWRVFRIMSEFIEGFQVLADIKKAVSIFGSTRLRPANRHYKEAYQLAKMLAKEGFVIVTGGGPGIMEAANRGAYEVGVDSVGFNIQLPTKQRTNRYVTKAYGFYYFFTRKVMLSGAARAYVFFPGGFGTLDEFSEIVMLVQTKKMQRTPIVLVGRDFWEPLLKWVDAVMYRRHQAINKDDMKLYTLVDSAEEAFKLLKNAPPREHF